MISKKIQHLFKSEYIMLVLSALTFLFSIYTKNTSQKKFNLLENDIFELQTQYNCIDERGYLNLILSVQKDFQPFSNFSSEINESLSSLINSFTNHNQDFLTDSVNFQILLQNKKKQLDFGYDSLIFSSFILIVLTTLIFIYKNLTQKNELMRIKATTEAHRQFSRDLHDGAAQDIMALKLYLEQDNKEKSKVYADHAFKEIRYLIDSLHLDLSSGIKSIMEGMLTAFETNYSIATEFNYASEKLKDLPQATKVEIIRIIQESLSNTARHSGATKVVLKIIDSPEGIRITFSDNGTGFDIKDIKKDDDKTKHYGLQNIKERVYNFGGEIEFITEGGTTIVITIKNSVR